MVYTSGCLPGVGGEGVGGSGRPGPHPGSSIHTEDEDLLPRETSTLDLGQLGVLRAGPSELSDTGT